MTRADAGSPVRVLGDALPDALSASLAVAALLGVFAVARDQSELAHDLAGVDPWLQLSAALGTLTALRLAAEPYWRVALGGVALLAFTLLPLFAALVSHARPEQMDDRIALFGWILLARGWNAWLRFPQARAAKEQGRFLAWSMLPMLQSMLALGAALVALMVLMLVRLGRPDQPSVDVPLLMVACYFAARAALYLPPLQRRLQREYQRPE